MKHGYFVALGGVALFFIIVVIAAVLDADGEPGALVGGLAFLTLVLGLWVGTALVAVEKGYHVVLGVILGVLAPLGLLVVALLPDRSRAHSR